MGRYNEDVLTCLNCGETFAYEPGLNEEVEAECYYCRAIHVVRTVRSIGLKVNDNE